MNTTFGCGCLQCQAAEKIPGLIEEYQTATKARREELYDEIEQQSEIISGREPA